MDLEANTKTLTQRCSEGNKIVDAMVTTQVGMADALQDTL